MRLLRAESLIVSAGMQSTVEALTRGRTLSSRRWRCRTKRPRALKVKNRGIVRKKIGQQAIDVGVTRTKKTSSCGRRSGRSSKMRLSEQSVATGKSYPAAWCCISPDCPSAAWIRQSVRKISKAAPRTQAGHQR